MCMGMWIADGGVSDNWEIPYIWAFGFTLMHKILIQIVSLPLPSRASITSHSQLSLFCS